METFCKRAIQFVGIVGLWLLWKWTARVEICVLYWSFLFGYTASLLLRTKLAGRFLILLGLISNALVTSANGGTMPVQGMPVTMYPASPIWTQAHGAHWLFLADQRALYYFSLGDLCLLAGFLVCLIVKLRPKIKRGKRNDVLEVTHI
jgi:hypothetical protein